MKIDELKKVLEIVQLDNRSGSADILKQITIALKIYLSKTAPLKPSEIGEIINLLNSVVIAHGNFMIVKHFLYHWINQANKHLKGSAFNREMLDFMDNYTRQWKGTNRKIAHLFINKVGAAGKKIITLSNSKTLHDVFSVLALEAKPSQVVQLESRPVNEGRLQAEKLAKLGHDVTLITDAAAAIKMKDIDFIVSGADTIFPQQFINKTGTYQLALLALYFKKPLHVLTDSRKIAQAGEEQPNFSQDLHPPGEIWKDAPVGINIENFYFEAVPNHLVTSFITEDRTIYPDDFRDKTVEV